MPWFLKHTCSHGSHRENGVFFWDGGSLPSWTSQKSPVKGDIPTKYPVYARCIWGWLWMVQVPPQEHHHFPYAVDPDRSGDPFHSRRTCGRTTMGDAACSGCAWNTIQRVDAWRREVVKPLDAVSDQTLDFTTYFIWILVSLMKFIWNSHQTACNSQTFCFRKVAVCESPRSFGDQFGWFLWWFIHGQQHHPSGTERVTRRLDHCSKDWLGLLAKFIFKRAIDVDSTRSFNKLCFFHIPIPNPLADNTSDICRLIQRFFIFHFHIQHDPKQPRTPRLFRIKSLRNTPNPWFLPCRSDAFRDATDMQVMRWFWWVTSMPIRHHSRSRWPCLQGVVWSIAWKCCLRACSHPWFWP